VGLITEYFGTVDEFKLSVDDDLPSHVWIVPKNIVDLVTTSMSGVRSGGDSAWYGMHSLAKSIYKNAATETIVLDWTKVNIPK